MQFLAYLIELMNEQFKCCCVIFTKVGCPRRKKCFSGTTTLFKSTEIYLENLLKVLSRKVYPEFSSKINLAISLHDWFTLGALAADKNFILDTL